MNYVEEIMNLIRGRQYTKALARLVDLQDMFKEHDDILQSLINKVNRLTSNHRHGRGVSKKDLDELSNRQLEVEERRDSLWRKIN